MRTVGAFLYRVLLRLYPADVRERDGEEMARLFSDLVEGARRRRGRISALHAVARVCLETPRSAWAAHREGNVSMGATEWLGDAAQDTRFALRLLRRNAAFAVVVTLTLAVAVGANTAVFSVVNAVLLRPLEYPAAEELVRIHTRFLPESGRDVPKFGIAPAEVLDFRDASDTMGNVGYYEVSGVTLFGDGDLPARLRALLTDDRLLPVLGVEPEIGRWFSPEEDAPQAAWTVLLSHALWRSRFGADPTVVGRKISLSGIETEIIGVMPADFEIPGEEVDIYVPFRYPEEFRGDRDSHFLSAIGRLAPGQTAASARMEAGVIEAGWGEEYGHPGPGHILVFAPLQDDVVGSAKAALWMLFAAVALVLVIAAANVGNLLLARGESRLAEMAVRASMGAGRSRILRQMLTESTVLAVSGTIIGVGVAAWGVRVARSMDPSTLPRAGGIDLDLRVLAFTAAVVLVVTILFGLAPALQATAGARSAAAAGQSRATASASRKRFRGALVAAQVALSVVVVVGAGLFARSFVELIRVDTGMATENRLSFDLAVPTAVYEDDQNARAVIGQIREQVLALPGVTGGSYSSLLPFSGDGGWRRSFLLETRPEPEEGETAWNAETALIRPGWIETLRITLLKGRAFRESDGPETELVGLISREMERLFWPNEDPIGKRFGYGEPGDSIDWVTIVGVVEDTRTQRLDGGVQAQVYLLHGQSDRVYGDPGRYGSFVFETVDDPLALLPTVRRAIADVGPRLAISRRP